MAVISVGDRGAQQILHSEAGAGSAGEAPFWSFPLPNVVLGWFQGNACTAAHQVPSHPHSPHAVHRAHEVPKYSAERAGGAALTGQAVEEHGATLT